MKILVRFLLLAVVLGLTAGLSRGTTFNYQYNFVLNDNRIYPVPELLTVSGTLDGDLNGNFVDNVSNVTLFFNGSQTTGTIFSFEYAAGWSNVPIVSFDASQNNFFFTNSDWANGDFSYDTYFSFVGGTPSPNSVSAESYFNPGSGHHLEGETYAPDRWSLQAVPDNGVSALMLGGSLVCLGALRRKLRFGFGESQSRHF